MPCCLSEPDPYSSIQHGLLPRDTPQPEIGLEEPHCTEKDWTSTDGSECCGDFSVSTDLQTSSLQDGTSTNMDIFPPM